MQTLQKCTEMRQGTPTHMLSFYTNYSGRGQAEPKVWAACREQHPTSRKQRQARAHTGRPEAVRGGLTGGRGARGHTQAQVPEAPGLATWQNRSLHHPLSVLGINYPIAPGRIWELGGGCRHSAEACRAVFDAKYQKNPPRMDFYIFTFTIALIASQVTSSLIEELGCDKFINSK